MKEQNVAIFQKMPAISDRKVYECSKFQFLWPNFQKIEIFNPKFYIFDRKFPKGLKFRGRGQATPLTKRTNNSSRSGIKCVRQLLGCVSCSKNTFVNNWTDDQLLLLSTNNKLHSTAGDPSTCETVFCSLECGWSWMWIVPQRTRDEWRQKCSLL